MQLFRNVWSTQKERIKEKGRGEGEERGAGGGGEENDILCSLDELLCIQGRWGA